MVWAVYTTPEDAAEIESAFTQAGLTQGEWNRIKDYVSAWVAGKAENTPLPPEHPCFATDGATARTIIITHGTKQGWLAEVQRLLNRPQRDREILRPYFTFISQSPWYAVEWPDNQPPPPEFWAGMTCT